MTIEILDLKKIITHEYSLDNINQAIKTLRSGGAGRIIIKMD